MAREMTHWFRWFAFAGLSAGIVAMGVACTDDEAAPADLAPDGGAQPDANTLPPEVDAAPVVDAGLDASVLPATPQVLALPTTGHARLFNVIWAPDGSIYGVGQAASTEEPTDLALLLVKLTSTGAFDTTFGGGKGYVITNVSTGLGGDSFRGIVLQTQGVNAGKIVVAGAGEHDQVDAAVTTRDVIVARFNADGTPDNTFGTSGVQRFPLGDGTAVQQWGLSKYANDDLLVTGARAPIASDYDGGTPPARNLAVLRLNGSDGSLSTSFGQDNDGVFRFPFPWNVNPRTATILGDGTALVAAYRSAGSGGPPNRPVIAKLTGAGALDPSWGTDGVYFPESDVDGFGAGAVIEAYGIVAQGTKFVTTGYGKESSANTVDGWVSLRLTSTGELDSTYGTSGHVFFSVNGQNANSRNLYVLPDNRVVLLGGASPPKPTANDPTQAQYAAIAILTPDGQPDPTFSPTGPKLYDLGGPATGRNAHFFWSAAVSPDHSKFVVVGIKGGVTANADAGIAAGVDQSVVLFLPATQ